MRFTTRLAMHFYCNKENHKWHYYTSGNQYVEIDGQKGLADVPSRECEICGRFEQKLKEEYEVREVGLSKQSL